MPRTRTQLGLQDLSNVKQEDVVVKQEDQKDFKLLHSVKHEHEVESDGVKQERPDVKPLLDSNGNPYWDLGRSRRLFVSKFKGVEYVHIREFVSNTNTGQIHPGKKGITLKRDEWLKLLAVHDQVKFTNA